MKVTFSTIAICLGIMAASPVAAATIPDDVLDGLLAAGDWSPTADEDLKLREQLPTALVAKLVKGDRHSLGLLALTTSIGKWGRTPTGDPPSDPAGDDWRGPRPSAGHGDPGGGKHLMSYRVGGVGLPHADRGYLADFIGYLLANHPDIGPASERATMTSIQHRLAAKTAFDAVRTNPTFLKWMKAGLQQKDAQRWLLDQWLDRYWEPSLKAVEASGGTVEEALVNVRIRNTSTSLAQCAIRHAAGAEDRIKAELEAYASPKICPGAKPRYKGDRWGWMRRPVVLYDHKSP